PFDINKDHLPWEPQQPPAISPAAPAEQAPQGAAPAASPQPSAQPAPAGTSGLGPDAAAEVGAGALTGGAAAFAGDPAQAVPASPQGKSPSNGGPPLRALSPLTTLALSLA